MEVYWYTDRNEINHFYVKVSERTLRLFIKIETHNLGYRGCCYADRNGIDNFNVKVIGRFCYIILHNNDAG